MFKKKDTTKNDVELDNSIIESDIDYSNLYLDEYYDETDVDDILNEIAKPTEKRKRRKSPEEFYVKGADLINEIKKYKESKQQNADKNRCTV